MNVLGWILHRREALREEVSTGTTGQLPKTLSGPFHRPGVQARSPEYRAAVQRE